MIKIGIWVGKKKIFKPCKDDLIQFLNFNYYSGSQMPFKLVGNKDGNKYKNQTENTPTITKKEIRLMNHMVGHEWTTYLAHANITT